MTGGVPWRHERGDGVAPRARGVGREWRRREAAPRSPAAARSSARMEYWNLNSFCTISQVLEF